MAATTESVRTDAAEAPLLNKRNLTLGILLYLVSIHSFVGMKVSMAGQPVWTHSHLSLKHTG